MRPESKTLALLVIIVSLALAIVSCARPQPTPTVRLTTEPTPAPPADTPLPAAPLVADDGQPIEPEMILIAAGEFTMGSDPSLDQDTVDDERPQHVLYLPDYYLAKTPVTNAQYAAFVQATDHRPLYHWDGGEPPRGTEDHPVVNVSWYDAIAYSNWLADVTGKQYRLPSEAEWEKGARGSDGRLYPWGSQWDATRCNSREGSEGEIAGMTVYRADTTVVGAYPDGASPYGLLDMAGNVWEWTSSICRVYPYDPEDGREDLEAGADAHRVLRGGASANLPWRVRSAFRGRDLPEFFFWDRGFRVALHTG
jgi:formylglycine-generating enzyme required for sulfatase activity